MLEQRAEGKCGHAPQTRGAPDVEAHLGERFEGLVEFWGGSTMRASLHRLEGLSKTRRQA